MVKFTPRPLYECRKSPVPKKKDNERAPEPVFDAVVRYNLLPHQGIKPRMFQLLD
jgi:hypothetical protein